MPLFRSMARLALYHTGGLVLLRSLTRNCLRILMYHHFTPQPGLRNVLERRCEYLRKHYQPVSLRDVARAWHEGANLPPNALAVTVDDGYRDFYEIAYPVFRAYDIPVTVFLVTGFVDGRCWLWTDRVEYAIRSTHAKAAEIPLPSAPPLRLLLASTEDRTAAAEVLISAAKQMPNRDRLALLEDLPRMLNVFIPPAPPAKYAPLTWNHVREMSAHHIDFGAHSETHPILSRLESEADLASEILDSKRRIEEVLDRPALSFCYPNGRWQDIGERAVDLVAHAGFQIAVGTEEGFNYQGADPLLLKRIPADPSYSEPFFREYVAGLHAR